MRTKQEAGSIDLYPSKSFRSDIRIPTFNVRLRGAELSCRAWICTDLQWQKPEAVPAQSRDLWSPRSREVQSFVRIDVHTGDFWSAWTQLAHDLRNSSQDWLRIHRLNCLQTLLGDEFCEQRVMVGRPFDPEDYRRKRNREFTSEGPTSPSTSTILSAADLKGATTRDSLWGKYIPEAARKALLLSADVPTIDPDGAEEFLASVGSFAAGEFEKNTVFRSKRDNFKNRYPEYDRDPERRRYFVWAVREAINAGHADLRAAALQIREQVYQRVETINPVSAPPGRYFDFWYGHHRLSEALGGLVLAATPIRSLIHRQPYAVLDAFEEAMFIKGELPDQDTLCAIYSYILTYPHWLEVSRGYDRARH
jgi:hypothetical protein